MTPELPSMQFYWMQPDQCHAHFFVDNESLANQLNLLQRIDQLEDRVTDVITAISKLWQAQSFTSRGANEGFFTHIPRKFNQPADSLVNDALDDEHSTVIITCHANDLSHTCELYEAFLMEVHANKSRGKI